MAANEVEKLEKKMGSKIEEVRDMMLDRFCGVDQKLTAIEELLRKIMEAQNQVGNTRVKDTCKIAVESSKSLNKENKVVKWGHDGAPSREYGASNPYGWVGLYTNPYSKDSPAGPDFGMGRDFCTPVWVGQQESNFRQKNRPYEGTRTQNGRGTNGFEQEVVKIEETGWSRKKSEHNGENIVKTGQDEVFKDSSKGTKKHNGENIVKTDQDEVFKDSSKGTKKHNGENIVKTDQDEVFKDSSKGTKKHNGENIVKTGQDEVFKDSSKGTKKHNGENIVKTGQDEVFKDSSKGTKKHNGENIVKTGQDEVFKDSSKGTKKHNGENIVKTGQNEVFKDSSKGTKKSCVASSGSWDKLADKTNVSLQGSAKLDPWGNKDSRSWAKEVDNERNGNCGSVEFDKDREKVEGSNWDEKVNEKTNSNDGWGKKVEHQSQAQGSWGWKKNDDWGPKRKRPSSPTGGPNDGPRYSGPFTATKQRLDIFTSDEQEILTEIEPIMISIKRILNQDGYNDGDPLSADDQTCIIDHVFNHHQDKDQKMGAGVDYVMVAKHKHFPDTRCLYVVSTDGRKEDFSYIKCLQNFVRRKYPDKGDEFISKYWKKPRPRHRPLRDMDDGSVLGETGRPPVFNQDGTVSPL